MQTIDCTGILYNHCIALHKKYYKLYGKYLDKNKLQKHIKKLRNSNIERFKYLKVIPSQSVQDITERIDKAYKLFFKLHKKKIKCSPPSFKKVKKYKSFTLKQAGYKFLEGNKIKIKKSIYKYSKSRETKGEVKTVTIKRDSLGDLWLCISLVLEDSPEKDKFMTGKSAGFDFGLKTFLTSSDYKDIKSPLFFKRDIRRIKKLNRSLSKKKDGSRNKEKARLKLARMHRKITNKRKDFHFKLALALVRSYDYMFFEDLNIKWLQKQYGRKVSDLGFYQFMQILSFKAEEYLKTVHKINRFFPSTKQCYVCGYKNEGLTLKDRSWICPSCKTELDRDRNASFNIYAEGASSAGLDTVRLSFRTASIA